MVVWPLLFFSEDDKVDDGKDVVETDIEQEIFPQQFIDAAAPSTPTNDMLSVLLE